MLSDHDDNRWALGRLPFVWNPLPEPRNPAGLPDTLDFTLTVDRQTRRFVQEASRDVSAALAHAYSLGSMFTGQMDDRGIGRRYADDFLTYLNDRDAVAPLAGRRVLEIGCGNGYLLHRLASTGATVLGLEPGSHGGERFDVPIIRDFFPSARIGGRFDRVLFFAVLEHVERPEEFLAQVFAILEPEGEVVLAVPDCEPYLATGDLSCLIHEHWSYFDRSTLATTLQDAGGRVIDVRASGFGGLLYARVAPGAAPSTNSAGGDVTGSSPLPAFRRHAERNVALIAAIVEQARTAGEEVGFYVPGRAVNALFAAGVPVDHCRFFDDNPLLKGTFFPGLPIPVEDRADLAARPPRHLLIMSRSFGNAIVGEIAALLPPDTRIRTWRALFEDDPRHADGPHS